MTNHKPTITKAQKRENQKLCAKLGKDKDGAYRLRNRLDGKTDMGQSRVPLMDTKMEDVR